jgi:hypothetical protein
LTPHFRFIPKADLTAEGGEVQRRAKTGLSAAQQRIIF